MPAGNLNTKHQLKSQYDGGEFSVIQRPSSRRATARPRRRPCLAKNPLTILSAILISVSYKTIKGGTFDESFYRIGA